MIPRSAPEPLSGIDAAWLRMDSPRNPMTITAVLIFQERLDKSRLRDVLRTKLLAHRRFLSRPVERNGHYVWVNQPDLDWSDHYRTVALPGAADKRQLQALVSDLVSTPFDRTLPLWRFDLVENYLGGCALIARIHHCYGDGTALSKVLLSLTDTAAAAPNNHRDQTDTTEGEPETDDLWSRLYQPVSTMVGGILDLGAKLLQEEARWIRSPAAIADYANTGIKMTAALARLIALPEEPDTPYKGQLGTRKRVAWTDPLRLDELKALSKALGCTVNDILLACVSGALRHALIERGVDVDDLALQAAITVNLRVPAEATELSNRFGLMFVPLPLGIADPMERLCSIMNRMRELKSGSDAEMTYTILSVLGAVPAALEQEVVELLSRKITAVISNLPGPREVLYLAGARLREIAFWVPQAGSVALGMSLLSYAGRATFGVLADRRRIADPERIAARFAKEFETLLLLTLMTFPPVG